MRKQGITSSERSKSIKKGIELGKIVDKDIESVEERIVVQKAWLKHVRRAILKSVKKEGWTADLKSQNERYEKVKLEIQSIENDIRVCKSERNLQKRFLKE